MPSHAPFRNTTTTPMKRVVRAVAIAAVFCAACSSLVCAAISAADFAENKRTNTLLFLRTFTAYSPALAAVTADDDFCTWPVILCETDLTLRVTIMASGENLVGALSQIPELPTEIVGSSVAISYLSISIKSANGIGTLPSSWSRLSALTSLSIHCSGVTGTLPASWGSLTSLTGLYLYNNALSGTLPDSWKSLTSLTNLNLDTNQLTGTLPPSWSAMKEILSVNLMRNQLTGSIPEAWVNMPKVISVALFYNNICGCVPPAWVGTSICLVDDAVKADDCATVNVCVAEGESSSSGSSSTGNSKADSNSGSSHSAEECAVSHCVTCATGNATSCVQCAQSYDLTDAAQCAQNTGNGAVRVSLSAGCRWMAVAASLFVASAFFVL